LAAGWGATGALGDWAGRAEAAARIKRESKTGVYFTFVTSKELATRAKADLSS